MQHLPRYATAQTPHTIPHTIPHNKTAGKEPPSPAARRQGTTPASEPKQKHPPKVVPKHEQSTGIPSPHIVSNRRCADKREKAPLARSPYRRPITRLGKRNAAEAKEVGFCGVPAMRCHVRLVRAIRADRALPVIALHVCRAAVLQLGRNRAAALAGHHLQHGLGRRVC